MSRSCQSGDVFQRRRHIGAHHAREPDQILRQHRIALVRHRRGALLSRRKILLRLEDLGALQVADFGRQPLDRGGDDAERGEIHGVAVARDNLGRDRLDREPHLLRHIGFDARIDLRESADRAGDRAGRDLAARRPQALAGAGELGIGVGKLEPEGRRLGVDAVRAADGRRELVLARAALKHGVELFDVGDQDVGCANELHVEAGVEHVGGGHPLVHEPRLAARRSRPNGWGRRRNRA